MNNETPQGACGVSLLVAPVLVCFLGRGGWLLMTNHASPKLESLKKYPDLYKFLELLKAHGITGTVRMK